MDHLAAVLIAAFAVSALCTPLFARLARRIGLTSKVRDDRWGAGRTIPLLGGAAMALALLVVLSAAPGHEDLLAVLGCAAAAFALGLLDDFRHLEPSTKLVGQVVVGSVLFFGGVKVEFIGFAPIAFLLTVFWVVAMMNALNLMDNMDGLAAGVTAIAAIALAVGATPDSPTAALLAAATAGISLGFLIHNFSPARVFMGDAGSMLLGFLLAATALADTSRTASNVGLSLIGPLAVLALPIFDTTLVAVSRRLAGRSVGQGGRDHTSHRLAALGMSDRSAVLTLYAVAAALAGLGVLADLLSTLIVPIVVLSMVALILFGIFLQEVRVYGWRGRPGSDAVEQSAVRRNMWLIARFGGEIGLDAILLTVAYYSSFLIRFEGPPEDSWLYLFVESVPIVVAIQLGTLVLFGAYRTLWRYVGVSDATVIVQAVIVGAAAAAFALLFIYRFEGYSRAAFIIDGLLAAALLVASRASLVWLQHWFARLPKADSTRVLIVGANDGGAFAHRLLTHSTERTYHVVGFLDDDPGKRYRNVAGVRIVGTTADLPAVVERLNAELVVLALGQDDREATARIRAAASEAGIECRELILPL
ncbi:MAG: hypothetical protein FJ034_00075 [Chloroflexi bacterium]|nr:hypothetical protein [Chloroflexota bacterium]